MNPRLLSAPIKLYIACMTLCVVLIISPDVLALTGDMTAPPVHLTLIPVFDPPSYDYNSNIAAIQELAADTEHTIHEALSLGITRYKPFLQFSVPIKGWTDHSTGVTCMHLEDAEVKFGYHDVTVYIANEIPYQSCGFNAVYEHEQKHIAVNERLIQEYTPLIQSTLQEYLNKFGVMCSGTPNETEQKIDQTFQAMLTQWNAQISAENHRRQQEVDSIQEYQRITDSCDGQLKEIAKRFLTTQH